MARRSIRSRVKRRVRKTKSRVRRSVKRATTRKTTRKVVTRKTARAVRARSNKRTLKKMRTSTKAKLVSTKKRIKTAIKTASPSQKKAAKRRLSKMVSSKKSALSKRVAAFKRPDRQLKKIRGISPTLGKQNAAGRPQMDREGKKKDNAPAIWEKFKDKLPKFNLKLPKIPKPDFSGIGIGLMGLKDKIPKLGFPKLPPLPDVGGWFKEKAGDVTDSVGAVVDTVTGAATEYQEKRERKSLIRKIIMVLVLAFAALLAWKKVK